MGPIIRNFISWWSTRMLTFIVRHLNPVFVLTVRSFLRDGPLNAQYTCRGLER